MNTYTIENIVINGTAYHFISDYKDIDYLRRGFNELATECFEFDLEEFYQQGYWDDRYIPYSIIADNRIVANVSIANSDFTIEHVPVKCVQILTVMTSQAYRNRGLCRFLMEKVLFEWKNKCDLVYLFANDSAVNLYSRFGFYPEKEFIYSKRISKNTHGSQAVKLDMNNKKDSCFIIEMMKNSACIAEFASFNSLSMQIYYCTTTHKDHIYYLKNIDTIIISERRNRTVYLHDFYCREYIETDTVIDSMNTDGIDRIVFGFTPIGKGNYDEEELKIENSTFFILDDKKRIFNNRKIQFPTLTRT